jgi:hypothetical protein
MIMSRYNITCCHAVVVERFTVERPMVDRLSIKWHMKDALINEYTCYRHCRIAKKKGIQVWYMKLSIAAVKYRREDKWNASETEQVNPVKGTLFRNSLQKPVPHSSVVRVRSKLLT